jgi:hypothetical protein
LSLAATLAVYVYNAAVHANAACIPCRLLHNRVPLPVCCSSCELMIGCVAKAQSYEVLLNTSEMEDVQWYDRAELAAAVQWYDNSIPLQEAQKRSWANLGFFVPPPFAIAHHIMRAWALHEVRHSARLLGREGPIDSKTTLDLKTGPASWRLRCALLPRSSPGHHHTALDPLLLALKVWVKERLTCRPLIHPTIPSCYVVAGALVCRARQCSEWTRQQERQRGGGAAGKQQRGGHQSGAVTCVRAARRTPLVAQKNMHDRTIKFL